MFSARAYIQPSRSPLIQAAARLRDMTGSLLDPGGPRPSGVHRLLLRPDDPVHARARAGTGHLQRLQRLLVLGQAIVRGPAPRSARGDLAMVKRGPVRGPSHPCEQCNQGHRRHGSVVSVQVAHPERRAVLLIIRRSWVRAPPAPSAVIRYIRCRPWTDAGGIAYRQIGLPGQHLPSQISRQRGPARTRLRFQLTPRPRCGDPQAKTHPRPIGTAPAGQQAFPIRPSKGPEPLKGKGPQRRHFRR
jgi:hypothetical protein